MAPIAVLKSIVILRRINITIDIKSNKNIDNAKNYISCHLK